MPVTNVSTAGYLGILFLLNKRPNAFIKMAGRFAGDSVGEVFAYKETTAVEFPIGVTYSLPAPSQPAVLEGANAPAATSTSLTQSTNVVQLYQETVSATYLAQSDRTISGTVPVPLGEAQGEVQNPRSMEFQIQAKLQKIAQDLNYTSYNGAYAKPADPSASALKSRGIITAIATNLNDQSATGGTITAQQYRGFIDAVLSSMASRNGYMIDETIVVFCGVAEFGNIAHAYGQLGTIYLQPDSTVAGLQTRKILTTFGTILLTLDPDVPAQNVLFAKMDEVGLVGLMVPDKGVLFEESLYKQGSADQTQIYGQIGLDHAPEYYHGLLKLPAGVSIPL